MSREKRGRGGKGKKGWVRGRKIKTSRPAAVLVEARNGPATRATQGAKADIKIWRLGRGGGAHASRQRSRKTIFFLLWGSRCLPSLRDLTLESTPPAARLCSRAPTPHLKLLSTCNVSFALAQGDGGSLYMAKSVPFCFSAAWRFALFVVFDTFTLPRTSSAPCTQYHLSRFQLNECQQIEAGA